MLTGNEDVWFVRLRTITGLAAVLTWIKLSQVCRLSEPKERCVFGLQLIQCASNEICMYKVRSTIFLENSPARALSFHVDGKLLRPEEKKVCSVTQQDISQKISSSSSFFFLPYTFIFSWSRNTCRFSANIALFFGTYIK